MVLISEEEILEGMRLVWERLKLVIEPSSAVTAAALLGKLDVSGKCVGILLSGGNVDLDRFFESA